MACGNHTHLHTILYNNPSFKISSHIANFSLMASSNQAQNPNSKFTLPMEAPPRTTLDVDLDQSQEIFDYSKRSQWLRAAVLGANDGLVSTASLMMGVGAVRPALKTMILTGFAGLVAGACSMAIGEFVSVYSQLDIERSQMKREQKRAMVAGGAGVDSGSGDEESLPNPVQAAAASALAFSVGAMVPLLAASFINEYRVRIGVMAAAVSLALVVFGWLGAVLGHAPLVRSSARVLVGGWLAMAVTFGLTKLIGSKGL